MLRSILNAAPDRLTLGKGLSEQLGCRDTLDLRRGYEAPFPPSQVNDSNKGSNGPAG